MNNGGDRVRAFVAHVVVMDEVFAVAERFDFLDFVNVLAILRATAEFPDCVTADVAVFVVIIVAEFLGKFLCAIPRHDGIVCVNVPEDMPAVESLDFIDGFRVCVVAAGSKGCYKQSENRYFKNSFHLKFKRAYEFKVEFLLEYRP